MLSGGKANDLAGLFLFDTMYVTDAEKKAKKKLKVPTPDNWKLRLEGKVEAYVKARFDADLDEDPGRARRPIGAPGSSSRGSG